MFAAEALLGRPVTTPENLAGNTPGIAWPSQVLQRLAEAWSLPVAVTQAFLPAIRGALSGAPINGRVTLSGYEGSELIVARLLIESGADGVYFWWYPGGFRVNENSDYGIINPDGTDQRSTGRFSTARSILQHHFPIGAFFNRSLRRDAGVPRRTSPVDLVKGCALAVRRDAFDAVGGWDESYFMYSEERELCYALQQAGYVTGHFGKWHMGDSHHPQKGFSDWQEHAAGRIRQVITNLVGNAIKYIWRADLKHDAVEDLKKARWYIDREITRREKH